MDTKKSLLIVFCVTALIGIVCLLCFKGIKVNHDLDGTRQITVPETDNQVEIKRPNGKEPFRFNIKVPERKLLIEKPNQ
jgi:hypothetical protein